MFLILLMHGTNMKIHVTCFSETSGNFLSRSTASRWKRIFVSSVDIKRDVLISFFFLPRLVSQAHGLMKYLSTDPCQLVLVPSDRTYLSSNCKL